VFQRIGQEYASRIHAVDVVNSSDAAHFIVWKRDGLLASYVPEDVARHFRPSKDPDGTVAPSWLVPSASETDDLRSRRPQSAESFGALPPMTQIGLSSMTLQRRISTRLSVRA